LQEVNQILLTRASDGGWKIKKGNQRILTNGAQKIFFDCLANALDLPVPEANFFSDPADTRDIAA
jgi:hypothetical protein